MRERFHAEPIIKASELLLQERMPRDVATSRPWAAEVKTAASARDIETAGGRLYTTRIRRPRRRISCPTADSRPC